MIKRLLLNLRQKPKHVRNNIALGIAGSFTAFVFLIWAVTLPSNLASRSANLANSNSAFETLFGTLGDGLTGSESQSSTEVSNTANTKSEEVPAEPTLEEIVSQFVVPTSSRNSVIDLKSVATTSTSSTANEPEPRVVRIITTATTSSNGAETVE